MKISAMALLALLAANQAVAVPQHPCAADARDKAKALLTLHMDGANMNVDVDDKVVRRAPVRALKGKGKFDVLEVIGYVYKAQYRIRMIYAPMPDKSCVLMGQEIFEIADPY